jgi:hypothetical protein
MAVGLVGLVRVVEMENKVEHKQVLEEEIAVLDDQPLMVNPFAGYDFRGGEEV